MAYGATATNPGVILFGGGNGGGPQSDTWQWTGSNWVSIVANGPTGRQYSGMSYDASAGHFVLFGGEGGVRFLSGHLGVQWRELDSGHHRSLALDARPALAKSMIRSAT